mmetsp:Transcript_52137/g.156491  ORF Transcript_52137/g.156491 Transcript_52137/m.156491 type:complete len:285 (+) Transcript_52137:1136-1990(+)
MGHADRHCPGCSGGCCHLLGRNTMVQGGHPYLVSLILIFVVVFILLLFVVVPPIDRCDVAWEAQPASPSHFGHCPSLFVDGLGPLLPCGLDVWIHVGPLLRDNAYDVLGLEGRVGLFHSGVIFLHEQSVASVLPFGGVRLSHPLALLGLTSALLPLVLWHSPLVYRGHFRGVVERGFGDRRVERRLRHSHLMRHHLGPRPQLLGPFLRRIGLSPQIHDQRGRSGGQFAVDRGRGAAHDICPKSLRGGRSVPYTIARALRRMCTTNTEIRSGFVIRKIFRRFYVG